MNFGLESMTPIQIGTGSILTRDQGKDCREMVYTCTDFFHECNTVIKNFVGLTVLKEKQTAHKTP